MKKVIGITGRSCSGKSTLAQELNQQLSDSVHIDIDDFFDYAADFDCENPGKVELKSMSDILLALQKLKQGENANFKKYNFKDKLILDNMVSHYAASEYIIVEGALVFWNKELRNTFDLKVFVDVPNDICLQRRLERGLSTLEKGSLHYKETEQYILNRWAKIAYQWDNFLQPLKKHADIVISHPEKGIKRVIEAIKQNYSSLHI